MTTHKRKSWSWILFAACIIVASLPSGYAYAQAPFYQGKTITVIVSTSPAGTGDLRIKALMPFLKKHIPGNPTLVLEYMDGGGGRKAANYMFRNAKPDGLTIGAMGSGVISLNSCAKAASLRLDKFIYLGAPETPGHQTIYTRKDLGLNSLEKLRAKPGLRIGAQTVGHVSYIAGRSLPISSTSRIPNSSPATPRRKWTPRCCAASSTLGRMRPCRSCGATPIGWTRA